MADQFPLASLSEHELERRLTDLGPHLFPVTPDLATRVRHQLENDAARKMLTPNRHPRDVRWELRNVPAAAWMLAALVLILIAAGLTLFPAARNAIADRLGLGGVLIQWVDEIPPPEPSQVGVPLTLGRRVTLDEARAAVDFPVLVPTAADFDTPGEIYLLDGDEGEMVSFVYPAGPGLPESDVTGVGALMTQFPGEADRGLIEKGLPDSGPSESRLEAVSVGGEPGFWISGAPHGFFFVCYDVGECRQERYRLAGNVLLWEQDGLTLRLESTLSLDEALAIAESVRALE